MNAESEAGFTTAVVALAKLHGWAVNHQLPLRTARGWATGTQGDIGFPDIIAVRAGRQVVAELKSARGRLRPEQESWLARFRQVPGVEVFVWRPHQWAEIAAVFGGLTG